MSDGMKQIAKLVEAFADEHIRLCAKQGVSPHDGDEDALAESFFDVLIEDDIMAAVATEIARMVYEKARTP
jgi:hypothetical protein